MKVILIKEPNDLHKVQTALDQGFKVFYHHDILQTTSIPLEVNRFFIVGSNNELDEKLALLRRDPLAEFSI